MKSIKSRLIVVFTLLLLISLGGLGYLSISSASKTLLAETEGMLLNTAVESTKYVEARVNTQRLYMETLALNPIVLQEDIPWDEKVAFFQKEAERSGYFGFALADTKGQSRIFDSAQTVLDISEREYYKEALAGKPTFSDVLMSKLGDGAILIFAVPVKEEGKIIGVFYGWRDGLALSNIVEDIKYGEEGYAYAINRQGIITGHKNTDLVINQFNPIEDAKDNSDLVEFARVIEEHMIKGEKGVERYFYEGKVRLMGFAPVENSPWIMAVAIEEDEVLQGIKKLRYEMMTFAIFIILGGIGVIYFVSGIIADPIKLLSHNVNALSNYDLSLNENSKTIKYLKRKDEIGLITNSLRTMQMNFIELIKNIAEKSERVASSAEELTATSQQSSMAAEEVARTIGDIAGGANEQAKNTEEGVIHINQLGELIEKDQEHLLDLNTSANEVSLLKDEGLEVLKELVEKTQVNNKASKDVQDIIINTNESAEKIEKASQMIKSIADQTNLLALNAAIEAARAGEAGRGFAVVAEEIRKLAEQSNSFTGEINSIIQELIIKTGHAVKTMEEVGKALGAQTESVEKTNEKFEGIATAIEKMKKAIDIINQSSSEMEVKKEEIIGIIESLSAISEENAAGTQEASASVEEQTASMEQITDASEELAKLAEEMQESVSRFRY